ncbi:MAG: TauD/TfdA family dioxygenase [Rhodospirillaceae bacterium]|nr:TauD/TfdA family dioxygenase [Rhodospirillaceae bacterium]
MLNTSLPNPPGAFAATQHDAGPMTVSTLGGVLGARVGGISLAEPLTPSDATRIKAAFAEHSMLLFDDQDLTPDHLIAFGNCFGEIEDERFIPKLEGHPGVHVLKGISGGKLTTQNLIWHVDHSYKERPLMMAALYALDVPTTGGDTLFANMAAAYEALSGRMKAYLEGLSAVHDVASYGLSSGLFDSVEARSAVGRMPPAVTHPLVVRHPVSNRKTLFVNQSWTTRILGLDPAESRAILDYLFAHATRPEFQYRLKWRNRTLCAWDNLALQHRGIPDYSGPRLMYRVSVAGTWRPS